MVPFGSPNATLKQRTIIVFHRLDQETTLSDSNQRRHWPDDLECKAIHHLESTVADSELSQPQVEDISLASVWRMQSIDAAEEAMAGQGDSFIYRRDGHPNEKSLANRLARLHQAENVLLTAQGMSAIASVAFAFLKPNTQAWVAEELYGKSVQLFRSMLSNWGVETRLFDPTSPSDIDELGRSSASVAIVETMSNPRLRIPDLQKLAQASEKSSAILMVDNTFATHLLCRPLTLGADVVVESLGKQVNGHSDSMIGLVACKRRQHAELIQNVVTTFGMASSPLDCYLTTRGLATLAVRVQRACENALALSQMLESEMGFAVDYPGLASHPQYNLATAQLDGIPGWMLSLHLAGKDRPTTTKFLNALQPEITFSPSLGDVCTTVSHPESTSHRGLSEEQRAALGISAGTVRISCGLEPTDWLLERFRFALQSVL